MGVRVGVAHWTNSEVRERKRERERERESHLPTQPRSEGQTRTCTHRRGPASGTRIECRSAGETSIAHASPRSARRIASASGLLIWVREGGSGGERMGQGGQLLIPRIPTNVPAPATTA